jgi:hypothetical protein
MNIQSAPELVFKRTFGSRCDCGPADERWPSNDKALHNTDHAFSTKIFHRKCGVKVTTHLLRGFLKKYSPRIGGISPLLTGVMVATSNENRRPSIQLNFSNLRLVFERALMGSAPDRWQQSLIG